ncbi:SGNH/GDSL hydrolase family protein [Nocardioides alcanivorans]|uniref:SGNH/GDSL hydrolase family protein n=1 Tax=Nocardioides alcanivorans TaxID=2897352 RepID=UPI001F32F516|nr:SGNH/GDSL hydrolase family protein [Nocardioides alcanivorans]
MSQLPLRVLVKGASTVNWTSWMSGPRTDFIFPRVIEEQLLADDRPCHVQTISMTSEKTSTILSTWQREVLNFSPDVIVLLYGHYETIHLFLPRWLERHANSLKARPRWWSHLYRQKVLRPLWMVLAKLQARADRLLDPTIRRNRPKHVAADLRAYIDHVQQVGSPLVFCLELLPPTERYQGWFPGMEARMRVMNQSIRAMVAQVGRSNVRYLEVRPFIDAVAGGDPEVATPDGFHYSPAMHRAVGEALAAEIKAWAETQPHLRRCDHLSHVDEGSR